MYDSKGNKQFNLWHCKGDNCFGGNVNKSFIELVEALRQSEQAEILTHYKNHKNERCIAKLVRLDEFCKSLIAHYGN